MSIITDPETPVPEHQAFLASLDQYPDGSTVTSAPVSFADRFRKRDWIMWFQFVQLRQTHCLTSQFQHPSALYVVSLFHIPG